MTQKPQQRRGLGRGLGSLIPTAPRPEESTTPQAAPFDPGAPTPNGSGAPDGRTG